jgi:hypothetical protein
MPLRAEALLRRIAAPIESYTPRDLRARDLRYFAVPFNSHSSTNGYIVALLAAPRS